MVYLFVLGLVGLAMMVIAMKLVVNFCAWMVTKIITMIEDANKGNETKEEEPA